MDNPELKRARRLYCRLELEAEQAWRDLDRQRDSIRDAVTDEKNKDKLKDLENLRELLLVLSLELERRNALVNLNLWESE